MDNHGGSILLTAVAVKPSGRWSNTRSRHATVQCLLGREADDSRERPALDKHNYRKQNEVVGVRADESRLARLRPRKG